LAGRIGEAAAIAHQAAGEGEFTVWEDRRQRMAGRQCGELVHAPVVEGTVGHPDPTSALLPKSCEGRFEFTIVSRIRNNELQAQCACRCLQVRRGVPQNAEQNSIVNQLVEQLQSFWHKLGR